MEPLLKEKWSDIGFYIELLMVLPEGQRKEPFEILDECRLLQMQIFGYFRKEEKMSVRLRTTLRKQSFHKVSLESS